MRWNLKTVETRHAPVRYLEGGKGEPLVFLHGAGGMTPDDPFLAELAERYHVYAPLLPGYGETEECGELRDMLDFTLHTWDVVEALGLKDPILVGHSMGGMIAAEMAAIAPQRRLAPGADRPGGPVARRSSDPRHLHAAAVRDAGATCSMTRRRARR